MRRFVMPIHRRRGSLFTAGVMAVSMAATRPAQSRRSNATRAPYMGVIYNPEEEEFSATAETVIDDPREPQISEIGLLDSRGVSLVRVTMPIKVAMGFHTAGRAKDVVETVEFIAPADNLSVTEQAGHGTGWIDLAEVEAEQAAEEGAVEEESEVESVEMTFEELARQLRANGIQVELKSA